MKYILTMKIIGMSLLVIINFSCEQKTRSETKKDLPTTSDPGIVDNEKKRVELKESEQFEGFIDYGSPIIYPIEKIVITESRIEMPVFKTSEFKKQQAEQDTAPNR